MTAYLIEKDRFIAAFQEAREYLFRREQAWLEAAADPLKVLTRLFDPEASGKEWPYSLDIRALERVKDAEHQSLYHLFWHQVDPLLTRFFHALDAELSLVAESPHNIPHSFRLVYGKEPILSFSITEHAFRDERRRRDDLVKALARAQEHREQALSVAKRYEEMQKNPRAFVRDLGDWWAYLFKQKIVAENLDKRLAQAKERLAQVNEAVMASEALLDIFDAKTPAVEKKWAFFQAWFRDIGYTEEERWDVVRAREQAELAADEAKTAEALNSRRGIDED